jgi:hypothetical protein
MNERKRKVGLSPELVTNTILRQTTTILLFQHVQSHFWALNSPCQLHLFLPPDLTAPHTSGNAHVGQQCEAPSCRVCPRCEAVLLNDSEVDQQRLCGHQNMPGEESCNPNKHIQSPLQ